MNLLIRTFCLLLGHGLCVKIREISMKTLWSILCVLAVLTGSRTFANTVSVDTDTVITTNIRGKLGINLNAGVDKDTNRPAVAALLHEAITDIGAKVIRYPGGKKSL